MQAQVQCCCDTGSGIACFDGNAAFDCDFWCVNVLGFTNAGSSAPYSDAASCAANCAVPVELSLFIARANREGTVELKWTTETEIDNRGFEIQRMSGIDLRWETLDFVDGRGTSYETQEYTFYDENPLLGINYYRLKQLDFNGESNFSPIEAVNKDPKAVFSVWPTVARDVVIVAINDDYRNEDIVVQVRDLMGKLLIEQAAEDRTIDVQSFSPGYYLISFYVGGQMYTQQFIKEN